MSASPTEIPINSVMERLKERVAEDAVKIAILQATVDMLEAECAEARSATPDDAPVTPTR